METLSSFILTAITLIALISPAQAADPSDARQPIVLTPQEYSWLLNEMRGHLDAIGAANQAMANGDMEAARQALLARGTARLKAPGRLGFGHKTTDAWRAMAGGMHKSYDAVAEGIANKETPQQVMGRIAGLKHNCAGCQASYRLVAAP